MAFTKRLKFSAAEFYCLQEHELRHTQANTQLLIIQFQQH